MTFTKMGRTATVLMITITCLLASLIWPINARAATDIRITISDPDKLPGDIETEGNTVYSVISSPEVTSGENKVLGTIRICGKPGIAVPVQPGDKIKVTLPVGSAYMQIPGADTYRNYVQWPATLDGKKNQICDGTDKAGMKFITATPNSITLEVANIDRSNEIMVLDVIFDKVGFSTVRLAPFINLMGNYSQNPAANLSRLEYFKLLFDVTMPFSSSPIRESGKDQDLKNIYSDIGSSDEIYKLMPFINAGIIKGYDDGLLRPQDNITRAEAASIIGRVFSSNLGQPAFTDQIPEWAQAGIKSAYGARIIFGYPDGSFQPDKNLSKAEAASMIQKALETYSYSSKLAMQHSCTTINESLYKLYYKYGTSSIVIVLRGRLAI